jgi:integrase
MPVIYKPGERKGENKHWLVRGQINGKTKEKSFEGVRNKRAAKKAWDLHVAEQEQRQRDEHRVSEVTTFSDALDEYTEANLPKGTQASALEIIEVHIGKEMLAELHGGFIRAKANEVYAGCAASTKNRQFLSPARTVLRSYEENHPDTFKAPLIKMFKETKPNKRPAKQSDLNKIIKAVEGDDDKYLLALLWDRQGWRITESLQVRWTEDPDIQATLIDLEEQVFWFYIPKADAWKPVEMHDDVFRTLANWPKERRQGRLFRWQSREGVYNWIKPLCKKLKIKFTPHMARHKWATERNEDGFTGADLVAGGTWTSVRSLEAYTSVDRDRARTVVNRGKSQKVRGKNRGKAAK